MKPLVLSILLSIAGSGVFAADAIDRTHPPEPGPPPAVSFPDYQEKTLSNGLKVFIVESDRRPSVTFRLAIKSGSMFDGEKPGLADLLADTLTRGTESRSAEQFAEQTDFIGANVQADASMDAIFVVAQGLTKYTDKVLALLTDAALHPAFPAAELEKQKKQMLSQLEAARMQPASLASRLRRQLIFGKHPYGASPTPESVQKITRDDLQQFHDSQFFPNNATLAVVGDVKASEIMPKLEAAFGSWKRGDIPTLNLPDIPKLNGVTVDLVDRPGSVQSNVVIAELGVPRNNPDLAELGVLNAALGGGSSGRLFRNLREEHGWTYGSYSSFTFDKLAGMFSASAEVRNEVTGPAIAEMLKELKRIRDEAIPDAELDLQREYIGGNYLLSLESDDRTAERVQDIDLFGLPKDFYKTYAQRVAHITPGQAQELARKYIGTDNLAIVVVGDAKAVRPQLEQFGKIETYDLDLKAVSADKAVEAAH